MANGFRAAADLVAGIAGGADRRAFERQRFVTEFPRPWGRDVPASKVMACAIEVVGQAGPIRPDRIRADVERRLRDEGLLFGIEAERAASPSQVGTA